MASEPRLVPGLSRRLSTYDAVVVGLTSMLGAGVFVVFAPAAQAAGLALFVGLAIAAVIALCNALSSAQLAQQYASSGGSYLFGRQVLGPWWGFVAGWGFVIGKTASCAAMAMTFATYALPVQGWWPRLLAAGAVVALTALNLRGVTRTATAARVLLTVALIVLGCFLILACTAPTRPHEPLLASGGVLGACQAAGLLFFAFAGYARIATLAEEVQHPELLPRAILIALGVIVALYAAIALALTNTLGADLANSRAPLVDAAKSLGIGWADPLVRLGAGAAALGALLALLAGVGRTTLAMARERDLPASLARVDGRHQVPDRAQLAIGVIVVALVLTIDLRGAIGFSSFGVLLYYAVTNLAALRQPSTQRHWHRPLQVLGFVGCLLLAATLPWHSVLAGVVVLLIGCAGRAVALSRR